VARSINELKEVKEVQLRGDLKFINNVLQDLDRVEGRLRGKGFKSQEKAVAKAIKDLELEHARVVKVVKMHDNTSSFK